MGVVALDHDRRRLDAGLVARRLLEHLDVEFAPLAPAHVHAQQHARPVAALGAAGAGMHFDIGVVGRRPRPTAAPRARAARLRSSAPGAAPGLRSRSSASPSCSPSSTSVVASSSSRSILASDAEPVLAASCARASPVCAASASFQRSGSSDLAFSSARRRVAVSTSKMPPQQSQGLLDRFDQLFRFGAHDAGNPRLAGQTSGPTRRCKRSALRKRGRQRAERRGVYKIDRSAKGLLSKARRVPSRLLLRRRGRSRWGRPDCRRNRRRAATCRA